MTKKERESQLRQQLIGKEILDIELFNVNDKYFVFDPESTLVVDGGIQIKLIDGSFILGWSLELECFNISYESDLSSLMDDLDYYDLDAKQIDGIRRLVGNKITELDITWDYFEELPWDGNYEDKKTFIPVELIMQFENKRFLQLALIDYEISKKPYEIINPRYSISGELLVKLYSRLRIHTANIK
jgi:hypothetical protein